ncbi:hypothetical protein AB0L14_03575 [Streptomyces sp. NPDC052727]|uniref:hypothetical protein n=1 Tax=Streptomyces sp. NPDC052727 TaxID=3154854 RepID=UPI00344308E7
MGPVPAGVLQLLALIGALALAYVPLGTCMARIYSSPRHLRVENDLRVSAAPPLPRAAETALKPR